MRFHVEALFTHDAYLRLLAINEPGGGPAPRFFLGRTGEGSIWRFRTDVADDLVERLGQLAQDENVSGSLPEQAKNQDGYTTLLREYAPVQNVWMGTAYWASAADRPRGECIRITSHNANLLRTGFYSLMARIDDVDPCLAIVRDGRAVTVCCSVRITKQAHEAGIETLPEFRGRGHAVAAASDWAMAVAKAGRVPLYSASWDNVASQRVASKAGFRKYGNTLHIT